MKCYHKIETLFNRSTTGDKRLIENSFRSGTIEMLANYPIWDFYEKLDGSNHQIEWDGYSMTLRGRTDKSNIPPHVINYYNSKFNNSDTEELFEQTFGTSNVILYFEAIGPKIQTYGAKYSDEVQFVLLDAYFVNSDSFANYEHLKDLAKRFDVKVKPLIGHGTLYDSINYVKTLPISTFAEHELPIEGVVCLPSVELKDGRTNDRLIVKIKCCDHVYDYNKVMSKYKPETNNND